ncbi:TSC22 domain family protein 1 isoform X3 [Kryptolebias marmoratus]|uniref:TSC22 domain family protein 1 isoform X3 n=1 Tax=Kryptolebias marmoratus TaxID=37003 RepID=UPI0007F9235C|nr:TSC22 domain family protein 1 isoform X3 [Kryptolebias marmoratus]
MRERGLIGAGAAAQGPDSTALKLLFWELEEHLRSSSGASVVAIDNKIEQAMDLVKSHLMYAVREEVEVLKEQIKELIERNTQLEQENNLLKTLASPEQMAQFQAQVQTGGSPTSAAQPSVPPGTAAQALPPPAQNSGAPA